MSTKSTSETKPLLLPPPTLSSLSSVGNIENDNNNIQNQKKNIQTRHRSTSSSSWRLSLVAASAALNSCNVGFDIGVNSPAGPLVQNDLHLTDGQLELFLGFMINAWALVGAMASAPLVQRYGCGFRWTIAVANVLFVAGTGLVIVSPQFGLPMLVGRAAVGLGVGIGFAVTPQYLSELSPPSQRGCLTSWSEIGCNVGIVLGFAAGLFVESSWRLLYATGCVLPVVMMVLCATVLVESPRWLVQHGRHEECLEVLQTLFPNQSRDANRQLWQDICNDLRKQQQRDDDTAEEAYGPRLRGPQDIERQDKGNDSNRGNRVSTDSLSSFSVWRWVLGCQAAPKHTAQMLRLALLMAISHQLCGIDAIQYYLVFILDASSSQTRRQGLVLLALGLLKLACLFVASSLVDRWGRRPLLLQSLSGMIVALLVIAASFSSGDASSDTGFVVLVTGLSLYLAFFSLGLGPLGWVVPPELVSTHLRSRALSLTTFANRLTATVMTSTMLSLANQLTWGGYFGLLALINFVIVLLVGCYLPETKGRTLEDIGVMFNENERSEGRPMLVTQQNMPAN